MSPIPGIYFLIWNSIFPIINAYGEQKRVVSLDSTTRNPYAGSSLQNNVIAVDVPSTLSTTANPASETITLSENDIWKIVMREIKNSDKPRATSNRNTNTHREITPVEWLKSAQRSQLNIVVVVNRRKRPSSYRNRKRNRLNNTGHCGACRKTRDRIRQFCKSNFVSRVKVNSVEIIGNETRYDVGIVETYKNNIPLLHREYLWVTNVCTCPRLRVRRQYVVMGRTDHRGARELRLLLDSTSFVRRYSLKQKGRLTRLKKRKKC